MSGAVSARGLDPLPAPGPAASRNIDRQAVTL